MSLRHNLTLILILILCFGFVMSCLGGWIFYDAEEKRVVGELTHDVDERAESFYRRLEINFETLRSLGILFRGEPLPDMTRFNFEAGKILSRYPDILALEWVPRITRAERPAYEARRRQLLPGFVISEHSTQGLRMPAGERAEYFPVHFREPSLMGGNFVLGFDLASNTTRLEILAVARDTGSPQATANISHLLDSGEQKAILGFLPIYKEISKNVTVDRENLLGFVTGAFDIKGIFSSSALSGEPVGIEMRIVDLAMPTGEELILLHESRTGFSARKAISYRKELPEILGQKWALVASPTAGYIAARRNLLPISIFALGVVFTLLMVLYIHFISKRSEIIQQTVTKKTIELNKANKMLEMISRTDALTGIANRRLMDEFIDNEWLRAIRNRSSLSFILIDIDFFKSYNDNYGHLEGDEVLRKVAAVLKNLGHRPGDLVARYGGDEFALILTDTEDSESVAMNCLRSIAETQIPHNFSKTRDIVTLSIGLCTIFPEVGTASSLVIDAADKALYQAKKAGRNRVEQVVIRS